MTSECHMLPCKDCGRTCVDRALTVFDPQSTAFAHGSSFIFVITTAVLE